MNKNEYTPYGEKWHTEMKRMTKDQLIDMVKTIKGGVSKLTFDERLTELEDNVKNLRTLVETLNESMRETEAKVEILWEKHERNIQ
jgi:exonuclease VII small subunit